MTPTPVEGAPASRRRLTEMEVIVSDVIVETPDAATLVLFTGSNSQDYKSGQFLTIDPHQFEALARFIAFFEEQKGRREPPRAYSMASAPHERSLAITIKEELYVSGETKYPPLLSPLLTKRIIRGSRLEVVGFTGPYTVPEDIEARTDHLVHVCAGSGSVPNFSILKHVIANHPRLRQTFLYSNKTWDDVIFARDLDALARRHGDRLRVIHTLTREEREGFRRGRIDQALLREAIPDPSSCIVYTCGPAVGPWERAAARERGTTATPRFLETVLDALHAIGVDDHRIKRESYG